MRDAGEYFCEALVYSSSPHITNSSLKRSHEETLSPKALPPPVLNLIFNGGTVRGDTLQVLCLANYNGLVDLSGTVIEIVVNNSTLATTVNATSVEYVFTSLTLNNSGQYNCIATVNDPKLNITGLKSSVTRNLTVTTFIPPVQEFKGNISPRGRSFIFTWQHPTILANLAIRYILKCIPEKEQIPIPERLLLSSSNNSAVMIGLYSGVVYNCSILTVTSFGVSTPKTISLTTPETVPSGAPVQFIALPKQREVVFYWNEPPVPEQNGELISYTLSCSDPLPTSANLTWSISSELNSTTVIGFTPNTAYHCSLTAYNSKGSGPHASITFITEEDYGFFQLVLNVPLDSCADFLVRDLVTKLEDVTTEVVEILVSLCVHCHITDSAIDKFSFSCYTQFPSHVTYRARLEGTSEKNSSYLVSLIDNWVRDGASITVAGLLMKVNQKCSVAITDLNARECALSSSTNSGNTIPVPVGNNIQNNSLTNNNPSITTKSSSSSSSSSSVTLAIVIVLVFVILISIAVVIVIVLVMKIQQAKHIMKKNSENEIRLDTVTSTNEVHEKMKAKSGVDEIQKEDSTTDTSPTDNDHYEMMSPSVIGTPTPAIPSPDIEDGNKEEEGVYEIIPGAI